MNIPTRLIIIYTITHNISKHIWWLVGILILLLYSYFFYVFLVAPFAFRWRAIYGEPQYPKGYAVHGIDISHHQGNINWNRLKNAMINQHSIAFIFMKATEGDSYLDPFFRINFYNSKEWGFIRGVYHFWNNYKSPRRQAYFFLAMAPLEPGDLPPVLDVETAPKNISLQDFQQNILTWLHIVEDKYHVKPIIYTYYNFKKTYFNDSRFDSYPYWVAHYYIKKVGNIGNWNFWQHTDAGKLPGIDTYVDLNVFNGSYYKLSELLIPKIEIIPYMPTEDSLSLSEQQAQSY